MCSGWRLLRRVQWSPGVPLCMSGGRQVLIVALIVCATLLVSVLKCLDWVAWLMKLTSLCRLSLRWVETAMCGVYVMKLS